MKLIIPDRNTPPNPAIAKHFDTLPPKVQANEQLKECILRFADRIYNGIIPRESSTNPLYKLNECLHADRLEYHHLQKLKEYYGIDIPTYLRTDDRDVEFIGYLCFSANEIRRALLPRYNRTDGQTLAKILASMMDDEPDLQ